MIPRRLLLPLALLAAIATLTLLWWAGPRLSKPAAPIPVVVSTIQAPHSGLFYIADAKGFFLDEGLSPTFRAAPTGYDSIGDVLAGRADFAGAAETPAARHLAEGKQPRVIATLFNSRWNSAIVARKDRGIQQPGDLKGRRIGIVFSTATHYMLETFLAFHDIPLEAVTLVRYKPDEMLPALAAGEIDAASIWNPFLAQMQQRLGDRLQTFYPQEFYSEVFLLVVSPDYVERQREAVDRMLRALLRADGFAREHPQEALRIIAAATNTDANALTGQGQPLTFELALQQFVLLAMENEVRWYFRRNLVPPGPFPDVLQAFEPEPLRALKPEVVTITK